MITKRILILCAMFCLFSVQQSSSKGLRALLHYGDSMLMQRYKKSNIDTMYITRPQTKWTLSGRINMSGATLETEGQTVDGAFKSGIRADYKSTVSLGVNYLGVSLALSVNPAKLMGKYDDIELNFSTYGNRYGIELMYQDADSFTGWDEIEGQPRVQFSTDDMSLKTWNVNAYYVFNHRRFSYPAAFTQGYIQRQSAGSFLLAVSGQVQRAEISNRDTNLKVINVGIGAGYGYNYVPARYWLLHLSALPTFIVYSNTSLSVENMRIPLHSNFPEVILTGRGAVIRQLGNMFVGATMTFYFTNIGDEHRLSIRNTKWLTRVIVGYRF